MSIMISFIFCIPLFIWQFILFLKPGLYKRENKKLNKFLFSLIIIYSITIFIIYLKILYPFLFEYFYSFSYFSHHDNWVNPALPMPTEFNPQERGYIKSVYPNTTTMMSQPLSRSPFYGITHCGSPWLWRTGYYTPFSEYSPLPCRCIEYPKTADCKLGDLSSFCTENISQKNWVIRRQNENFVLGIFNFLGSYYSMIEKLLKDSFFWWGLPHKPLCMAVSDWVERTPQWCSEELGHAEDMPSTYLAEIREADLIKTPQIPLEEVTIHSSGASWENSNKILNFKPKINEYVSFFFKTTLNFIFLILSCLFLQLFFKFKNLWSIRSSVDLEERNVGSKEFIIPRNAGSFAPRSRVSQPRWEGKYPTLQDEGPHGAGKLYRPLRIAEGLGQTGSDDVGVTPLKWREVQPSVYINYNQVVVSSHTDLQNIPKRGPLGDKKPSSKIFHKRYWLWFIILFFTALITPPDILSQFFLTVPLIFIFEYFIFSLIYQKHLINLPQRRPQSV